MMAIEIATFRVRDDAEESEFVAADQLVQTEFFYSRPGLVRRTTAKGSNGEWLVVTLWGSAEEADAAAEAAVLDPVHKSFMAHVDAETFNAKRFVSLD